MKELVIKFDLC